MLDLMGRQEESPTALGSSFPMRDKYTPRSSAAAERIVERALADAPRPLYVVGLGQFTNLASALLLEPRIADRVVFACSHG